MDEENQRLPKWFGYFLGVIFILAIGMVSGYQIGNNTNSEQQIAKNIENVLFSDDFPYLAWLKVKSIDSLRIEYLMFNARGTAGTARAMLSSVGGKICYGKLSKDWYLEEFKAEEGNVTYDKYIRCYQKYDVCMEVEK